jgi:hypothetical protein
MTAIARPTRTPGGWPSAALWFALTGPAVAFLVNLNASYFLANWACETRHLAVLHWLSAGTLALGIAGGVAAWIPFARARRKSPGDSDSQTNSRFLEVIAMMASGLFSLVILAQWLGLLMLDPCGPGMRHPQAPDARRPAVVEWFG